MRTHTLMMAVYTVFALVLPALPSPARAVAAAPGIDCASISSRYTLAPSSPIVFPTGVKLAQENGGRLDNIEGLLAQDGASAVMEHVPGSNPMIVVDFGKVVSGNLIVGSTGASSTQLGIAFSESLAFMNKNSDVWWGQQHTYYWIPPSGSGQFQTGLVTFRYVELFLTQDGSLGIDYLKLLFTPFLGTPDTYAGCFESSDDQLNRIWYAGAYTLELDTTGGVIVDGAKRDRAVWSADLALEASVDYLTHNQPGPVRNSLADLADHQRADGSIPPTQYGGYKPILYDYCAWWVQAFVEYYRHTGDRAFAEQYYPNLQKQMAWFPTKMDRNGLLVRDAGIEWFWTMPRPGEVTYINEVYYRALLDAAELAGILGHPYDASAWRAQAASLKQAINARLFDQGRGIYISYDSDRVHIPQDANVLAVLYGIAPPEAWPRILSYVKDRMWTPYGSTTLDIPYGLNYYHDKRIWPFMGYHELEARFAAGDDANALDLMRREWGRMLDVDPASTTWEWMTADGRPEVPDASLAHGWSAGATASLSERVMGVLMTSPLYATFDAVPHPADVQWARGRVPTTSGPIDVSWKRSGTVFTETLTVPAGTHARAGVPTFGRRVIVSVNSNPVWDGLRGTDYQALSDGTYVYLDLGPGDYHLESDLLPSDPRPAPGVTSPNQFYFPETSHYLSSGFKTFWEMSGGLPVFGFPMTEEFAEKNPDTGQVYPVQYFERQRFEYHPELAGTPYETLLGRLGVADAAARGLLSAAPFQSLPAGSAADNGCVIFPETGHQVCGDFLAYWNSHGLEYGDPRVSYREALSLFGYPISEEFTDPSTGLAVQYFERARFERHPDNPDPYKVLLGRLGAAILAQRGW